MLQLDVSGGSLPEGVMLRESPTLDSTGETTIADFGDGTYGIDSFFDIFTELSLDDGLSWIPDESAPAHVDLSPEPSSLAMLGLGGLMAMACRARRHRN